MAPLKRITVTAARKALDAVEGNAARFKREDDSLTVWSDDGEVREREEIVARQALDWLEAQGYDMANAGMRWCGYYVGLQWNMIYSGTSELIALNID